MKKRIFCLILASIMFLSVLPASAAGETKEIRILFTHDIHSHFVPAKGLVDGQEREYGGAARLMTLLKQNRTENSVYLDAGDFSMGTLLQAAYSTDAYELHLLGDLGCAVTTFGNHEFDYGDEAMAKMLDVARASGDPLPQIVQSNMVTDGELTDEQRPLVESMAEYGVKKYTVLNVNGVKIAVFGLFGIDSLECTPTTKMEFESYLTAAKKTVQQIKENEDPDLIVCLSHSGTSGDGKNGEDFTLAKRVPGIDVIISGHSHGKYDQPVTVGKTLVVASGAYLINLGVLDLTIDAQGVRCKSHKLIPCDGSVEDDPELKAQLDGYIRHVNETYLADEQVGYTDVICRSDFDFMPLEEMESTHQEYPFGDLIADSYLYEARRNGIDDVDVALVGLGTIRGSFRKGDITTADAFEMCSLGVGADGSAGHPVVAAYITGRELKLIAELDASFGPMLSYIKMSYAGLKYTFNERRVVLNKVTQICLVRPDGSEEEIVDTKLYKVACNMYAVNMLGMLNGLTRGILKVVPKYADGTEVEDFYDCSLKNTDGKEIKEWVAFKNYLMSFPQRDGVSVIPQEYAAAQGRKNKFADAKPKAILQNANGITWFVVLAPIVLVALIAGILFATRKRRKARRERRAAAKALKKEQKAKETE